MSFIFQRVLPPFPLSFSTRISDTIWCFGLSEATGAQTHSPNIIISVGWDLLRLSTHLFAQARLFRADCPGPCPLWFQVHAYIYEHYTECVVFIS